MNRREFISSTARATASAAVLGTGPLLRAFGQGSAGEAVNVAVIGFGVQGLNDANAALRVPNVRVVGASSCYDGHLDRARELLGGSGIFSRDYRALLDSKDVDAVIVATPDHWHTRACLDALDAGKDIYCEKPMTHVPDEGERLVKAVKAGKQIFQVGSQHTSSPHVIEARQLVADGLLGQVTQVKASWDTNNEISAWVKPIPPNASAETVDWERFQGSAPKHAFDPRRVFRWRTYREYGEGLAGDVLTHIVTTIHYLLDLDVPTVATAVGGRFVWKDDRNVYDTFTGGWEYPEGIVTILGASQDNSYDGTQIRIMGTKATMVLTFAGYTVYEEDDPPNWRYTTSVWPKSYREEYWASKGLPAQVEPRGPQPPREKRVIKQYKPPEAGAAQFRTPWHMAHFIACVRERRPPVQDVTMGNNAALTIHMANDAYYHKRVMFFDRKSRRLTTALVSE